MATLTSSSAALALSAERPKNVETQHEDMVHDAQLDFYGKRLATCSSDRTVKVFDIVNGSPSTNAETLHGHQGPVWQVAWAHPTFGDILASCSYDGKVIIWKDNGAAAAPTQSGPYGAQSAYAIGLHLVPSPRTDLGPYSLSLSLCLTVNSISWAPHELGSILACASSDGNVSVLAFNSKSRTSYASEQRRHVGTVVPGSLISAQSGDAKLVKRFASAGCDNVVKIWQFSDEANRFVEADALQGHTDWVRDVAFAPNVGLPRSYLATASQDRTVLIWTQDAPDAAWTKTALNPTAAQGAGKFPDTVWRVSWSVSGNVLAVSCGDGKITLWKENLKGAWECVSEMDS
ncbi:vesicle coat complex COPII, subunit SEC13 [Moesziomyces antarcticus T-34]|uniref:Vesicle coat complex COPII, subunit SEC13 n=1 Tax=Pseudozyma antarctica (strain T-34) TaxID=1151754 RepID=M9LYU4_PSEA3|nr:vesicle coat complex COPII, subunit SEC13 [Moesziomyces antarcticus T-34]